MEKIRTIYLRMVIWIYRKLNPKSTHVFWFSKEQYSIPKHFFLDNDLHKTKGEATFKGKKYSEMRGFEYNGGISNWDDAKIVGVGSISDVEWIYKSKP